MYNVIKDIDKSLMFLKHLIIQTTFSLSTNYILFHINYNISQRFGTLSQKIFSSSKKEYSTDKDFNDFKQQGIDILYPVFSYMTIKLVTNIVETIYNNWTIKKLKTLFNQKVFNDSQIGIKLSNAEETSEIVRNLPNDVEAVANKGLNLFKSSMKTIQNTILSFGPLYKLSSINVLGIKLPDLLLISFVFSVCKQAISSFITNITVSYNHRYTMDNAKNNTIISHDFSNIKTIFTTTAQTSVAKKHANLLDKIDELKIKQSIASSIHSFWLDLTFFFNKGFQYMLIGYKVFIKKEINIHELYAGFWHLDNVDSFFSWQVNNQVQIKDLGSSLDRLRTFLNKEKEILNIDQRIKYKKGDKLALKNLSLSYKDKVLLYIPSMEFDKGGRYIFSGASGIGKSSLMAKINGIIHDEIDGKGIIWNMQGKKKVMLTQDDYFPTYSSIFDVLCLTHQPPASKDERNALIVKAKKLLAETNFGRKINLEEYKASWSAELSGGQKKKIKIVSAILQNPELLLLDEVFVGIDKKTIKVIQKMLNRYLPSATIIAVDQHPDESKDFYTAHYNIENHEIRHIWSTKKNHDFQGDSQTQQRHLRNRRSSCHR